MSLLREDGAIIPWSRWILDPTEMTDKGKSAFLGMHQICLCSKYLNMLESMLTRVYPYLEFVCQPTESEQS